VARLTARPAPTAERTLAPVATACPARGHRRRPDYRDFRTVTTLAGVARYTLRITRCRQPGCDRYHVPLRPEAEGRLALPRHEFGLDVIACAGDRRYTDHRTGPEIHAELVTRGLALSLRTVTNLLHRFDELRARAAAAPARLRPLLKPQGRVLLAIDGRRPDVGHEVRWVIRDCPAGEVLLAKSPLSARQPDPADLLARVKAARPGPVAGVVSDGQHPIRKAVARALPGGPHQLCRSRSPREAARPIYGADRPAKKELKKTVRGVRQIGRQAEGRADPQAEVARGYCAAVRGAPTDDGRPPLDSAGLRLRDRLSAVAGSPERPGAGKGGRRGS
jgi:hypothetical protein